MALKTDVRTQMHATGKIALTLLSVAWAASSQAFIGFPDFVTPDGLVMSGNAGIDGPNLRIAPNLPNQTGSAWFDRAQIVEYGFHTEFAFRWTGFQNGGGEGFAFVIQNADVHALGFGGPGMGYGGIPNSIAFEFDGFQNGPQGDPNDNHLSIHTRGPEPNGPDEAFSIAGTMGIPNMSDGNVHNVAIDWHQGRLIVRMDGLDRINIPFDLRRTIPLNDGVAWCGFTASTSFPAQNHDILNWLMDIDLPGDANNDDCVDLYDYSMLAHSFGSHVGEPRFDPRTDFDHDGEITLRDYAILASNFGEGC